MENRVKSIPEGHHSITPSLIVDRAGEAIEFYKKAFGATLTFKQDRQDGKVMHSTLKIGDSIIMLADECRPHEGHEEACPRSPAALKGTSINLYLYVKDVDAIFKRAIASGGHEIMPLGDMFWGDRIGILKDPFGHVWTVATKKENLKPEQMKERMAEFCAQHSAVC